MKRRELPLVVRVVPSYRNRNDYTVELKHGCQYFRLDYCASRRDALWYARMFRKALRKGMEELG